MLKKLFLISFALCSAGYSYSQITKKDTGVSGQGIVSSADSIEIRNSFFAGLKEKSSGRITQAERYFKRIIELDPENAAALYELSNLSRAQQKDDLAQEYAERAAKADPDNKWYSLQLTDIYKQRQKLDQLPAVFDNLIRLEPDIQEYYLDKAGTYLLLKKNKEAEDVYKIIENKFGNSSNLEVLKQRMLVNQENPGIAIKSLEDLIKNNPENFSNHLTLSELYIKAGEKDKALALLKQAHTEDNKNPYIILLMADIYRSEGKDREAYKELKKVISDRSLDIDIKIQIILSYFSKLKDKVAVEEANNLALLTTQVHSTEAKAFAVYGDLQAQTANLAGARKSYRDALKLNNNVFQIWEQLLEIQTALEDYNQVIADGEEAIGLFPKRSPLYFFTGLSYAQLNKHEKAIELLNTATTLEPNSSVYQSQVYSSLGNSFNSLKKYKEADAAFDKALQLDPINAYALNNYAYYLSLRGEKLDKAAEMSLQTNKLQPNNASFEDTYAWVLFKQKKYEEARVWIEKAINNNKNNGVQLEHFGDILFHLDDQEQALKYWIRARELGVKSKVLETKINEKKYSE